MIHNVVKLILILNLLELRRSFQIFEFENFSTQISHPSKAYRGG